MWVALLALAFTDLQPVVIHDRCDRLEINHVYDCNGRYSFTQAIFWDWYDDGTLHVSAWSMLGNHRIECGQIVFYQRDELRCVEFSAMCETWTQQDPEIGDRQIIPVEKRRGLLQRRGVK